MTVQRLLFLEFPPDGPSKEEPSLLELFLNFSRLGPSEEVPSGGERPKLCFCEHRLRKIMRRGTWYHTQQQRTVSHLGLVSRRSYTPWRVGDRVLAISMVSPVLVSSLTSAERSLAFGD